MPKKPENGWACKYCGCLCESYHKLLRHINETHNNTSCQYCGQEFSTQRGCHRHELTCDKNPNSISKRTTPRYNKTNQRYAIIDGKRKLISGCSWNKGLTEKDDPRIKKSRDTMRDGFKTGRLVGSQKGKPMSEETKRKISETMKTFCAEHPDRVPYVLNHHSRGDSYPEMFFKNVLENANITYDKDFPAYGYFLDFAWPNAKAYFEVDGEQHYVDKRIVEHDVERTAKLDANGWKCLTRIRWSTFQKSTKEEQQKIIQDLISLINNAIIV